MRRPDPVAALTENDRLFPLGTKVSVEGDELVLRLPLRGRVIRAQAQEHFDGNQELAYDAYQITLSGDITVLVDKEVYAQVLAALKEDTASSLYQTTVRLGER